MCDAIAVISPALIAALAALGGVWLQARQSLQGDRLARDDAHQIFLRTTYEELTGLVMSSQLQAQRLGINLLEPSAKVISRLLDNALRVSALTTLYFPELKASGDKTLSKALSIELSEGDMGVLMDASSEVEAACRELSRLIYEHREKYT